MTKKSQKQKKEKTSKKVKFNLEKKQSPIKQKPKESVEKQPETLNIKSILKVKSSQEQFKKQAWGFQSNISLQEINFSKKCELALEKFFNENIDLFLTFFRKYDKKQIEKETEEAEEIEEEDK
jgi:hypothetical protein